MVAEGPIISLFHTEESCLSLLYGVPISYWIKYQDAYLQPADLTPTAVTTIIKC